MPITFNCPCGKILSSRESDAGLKAICPSCGRRVVVPGQIQVPVESKEQLRTAALKVDSWIHSHQRGIWYATVVLAILFVTGLIGYKYWRDSERRKIVEQNVAQFSQPSKVRLDPNADPEKWHESFDSFAVAMQAAIKKNELLEARFTGERVAWEVTFDEFLERNALYFREAEPLLRGDRGILVWATVLPSQAEVAEKLKPGQRIRLTGKIGPVLKGRSAEHPLGNITVRPLECTVEVLPETAQPAPTPSSPDTPDASE